MIFFISDSSVQINFGEFKDISIDKDQRKTTFMLEVKLERNGIVVSESIYLDVYNSKVLKLNQTSIELNNVKEIENRLKYDGDNQKAFSEYVLNKYRKIELSSFIEVDQNAGENWSTTDYMRAYVDNADTETRVADLGVYNSKNGILSATTSNELYNPYTKFMLAGYNDGTANIVFEHNRSGIKETATVSVQTLADKLYLISVYPVQKIELLDSSGFIFPDGIVSRSVYPFLSSQDYSYVQLEASLSDRVLQRYKNTSVKLKATVGATVYEVPLSFYLTNSINLREPAEVNKAFSIPLEASFDAYQ